ncbi:MAG TPA: asparagine synthase (glutamine-hydrolyzing) [Flavipsychrobacter sp.]|nr:asparagine synthase (glutamine-hydrolyzing) [Flavipsychrobacter sp.]
MCGITGYYALQQEAAAGISKVKQSTDKLFLRGPDCGNVIYDDQVALGHRRLSIIDTSHAADQPMKDVSGRYIIAFNGEIFNYRQLSEKYLLEVWQRIGGPKTTSDTEVLLYLLIEYGVECLAWLGGFFAFAFYDTETQQLLLARDPYGKKPLLFYADESQVAFASEMKALLEWGIPKNIDYTVLHQYFQLNYIPQPQSIFKNVQKLAPGHYMSVVPGKLIKPISYYDIKVDRAAYDHYSYEEAKRMLVQKMDTAVQDRMIADVPLGAFLSGGIDSSVVVALASRYTKRLNTFSVGYKNNPYFDETKYAQLVAKKYQTNHTVFSLSNNDFLEHVYAVLDYIDEPFADSSAIPVYILCKHTRKHVTVSLSGDGGDEVFAGYNKHGAEWKMRQASWVNELVKAGAPLWNMLPKGRNGKLTNLFRQLHRFAEGAQLSAQDRYWRWASIRNSSDVDKLFCDETKGMVNVEKMKAERAKLLQCIHTDDFNEVLLADMKLVLPGDMLVKVDLMSMANSLEVRSPFLDKDVVDFAFSLPSSYKIDGSLKKKIVQDAFRGLLPEEIYNRPKHGFEIPLLDWFRKELWSLINEDLLQADFVKEQGIFNVETIEELKRKLQSNNPGDSHATIWALIVFQYWWKKYMS